MADVPQHEFSAEEEKAMREGNRGLHRMDRTDIVTPRQPRDYAAPAALSPRGQADVKGAIEDIASRARGDR